MALPDHTVAVETQAVAPVRRRRWLVPALAAAVVVAAVAGLVVWWPWSADETRRDGLVAVNDFTDVVTDLSISPDGDTLATVAYGGTVRLWNVADGQQLGEEIAGLAVEVAFSQDGELLAVGGGGQPDPGSVRWFEVDTGRQVGRIDFPDDTVSSVLFNPDGRLVTESAGIVQWWDLSTRQEVGRLRPDASYLAGWIGISADGSRVATSGLDHAAWLWDQATGQPVGAPMRPKCDDVTTALAFSPDGRTLAVGGGCGTTTLWDVASGKQTGTSFVIGDGTRESYNIIRDVAFSPDGKVLATMVNDEAVRLWDVASGDAVATPPIDRPNAFAFTPDGDRMAISEYNDRVWLYTLPS